MTVRCKEDERFARDEPHASLVLAVCAPLAQEEQERCLQERRWSQMVGVVGGGGGGQRSRLEKRVEQGRTVYNAIEQSGTEKVAVYKWWWSYVLSDGAESPHVAQRVCCQRAWTGFVKPGRAVGVGAARRAGVVGACEGALVAIDAFAIR
jgi:hypothetical protein